MSGTGSRPGARPRRQPGEQGFSLLELIVAFAILSLSLVAIYQVVAGSFRGLREAEIVGRALLIAESKLAEPGRTVPLAEGRIVGDEGDGFAWVLDLRPLPRPAPGSGGAAAGKAEEHVPVAYRVAVAVAYRGEPAAALQTVRVGVSARR
ncbi:type IV pilus modification PilV family protein [Oceanibacterium hippocampi]|nr:type II secretion system protein [Oceanibacterium hippocampi]